MWERCPQECIFTKLNILYTLQLHMHIYIGTMKRSPKRLRVLHSFAYLQILTLSSASTSSAQYMVLATILYRGGGVYAAAVFALE